jgi:hypothetical protein
MRPVLAAEPEQRLKKRMKQSRRLLTSILPEARVVKSPDLHCLRHKIFNLRLLCVEERLRFLCELGEPSFNQSPQYVRRSTAFRHAKLLR